MPISIHDPRYQVLQAQLTQLRQAAGLTQVQLAERLKLGQSFVSKIERGEAYVEVLLLVEWCAACGGQATDIIGQLAKLNSKAKVVAPKI